MRHTATQGISLSHPHIWEGRALAQELQKLRQKQKDIRIVFTNGCYDILHPGHVDLLARAKMLGDILVLALNTDASIRTLGKGTDRPINPLPVRAFVAAHLHSVNYVTSFNESTPYNIIALLQPNILVKGGDWAIENIVGRDIVEAQGGLVVSLPLVQGFSTTALVEHIRTQQ